MTSLTYLDPSGLTESAPRLWAVTSLSVGASLMRVSSLQ